MSAKKSAKPNNVVAQSRKKSGSSFSARALWDNVKGIAGAVLLFFFIRAFFFEAYRIPSGSMIPSMLIGDWLFVNKMRFGPHVPFSEINLPGYAEPQRYDIAVFVSPPQFDFISEVRGLPPREEDFEEYAKAQGTPAFKAMVSELDRQALRAQGGGGLLGRLFSDSYIQPVLVKRIVGMPGDTLHMRDAALFVNGIEQRQGYGAESDPGDPNEVNPLYVWQHRFEARGSRFGAPPVQPTHDNWGPIVVPSGHYFMMGDNRYNSKDSRYWSFVPRENIRGRPLFVYYSYNPESGRDLPFLTSIRWGRLGHWIR